MSTATIDRGPEQRQSALLKANTTRVRRAQHKQEIYALPPAAGRTAVVKVLRHTPEYWASAKVTDLLLAIRKFGEKRCDRLLSDARVSRTRLLGALTPRERAAIADWLVTGRRPARPAAPVRQSAPSLPEILRSAPAQTSAGASRWDETLERIRDLTAAGLDPEAIAAVLDVDGYRPRLTADQVVEGLATRRRPRRRSA